MTTYSVVFYTFSPWGVVPTGTGSTFTYSGPATATGTATIFDTESGIEGVTLDDDNAGRESATANVTVGGSTSTGTTVDAERVWTVMDTTTGEIFEIAEFDVELGAASGSYTLSEQPLIVGHTYQILAYDSNPNVAAGDIAFSAEDFAAGWQDGTVSGTAGNDLIDSNYVDAQTDRIDDGIGAGASAHDDMILAGAGADTAYGGAGDDTILGEDGNDLLFGDFGAAAPATGSESLNWNLAGTDEADISGGFTQDTGDINVAVSFSTTPLTTGITVESTDTIYVGAGEPFSANSSLSLTGGGAGVDSTTHIDFSSATAGISNEVENISFRINDIDMAGWQDIITINAYDADGNPVPVTITISGNDSYSGNTITAANTSDVASSAQGSALITIAGPAASVEIIYANGGASNQALWISDVHFDTLADPGGDDSIDGGAGNDTIWGEGGNDTLLGSTGNDSVLGGTGNDLINGGSGNDTLSGGTGNDTLTGGLGADSILGGDGNDLIYAAQGDIITGGSGEDTFILTDLAEAGAGTITIDGGTTGEPGGDTLDLNGIGDRTTLVFTPSAGDPDAFDGSITLTDGTVVTFTNIEHIICFTPGTLIATPTGDRRVETLRPGDLVLTLDDGPQPLGWVGNSTVPAGGNHAPIRLDPRLTGARRPLTVSPQHRMLIEDWRAELMFGETEVFVPATHMLDFDGAEAAPAARVTYIHLMFDRHQVIWAEGAATESFHAAEQGLKALHPLALEDLYAAYPALRDDLSAHGPTARPCLKAHESRALLSRMFTAKPQSRRLAA